MVRTRNGAYPEWRVPGMVRTRNGAYPEWCVPGMVRTRDGAEVKQFTRRSCRIQPLRMSECHRAGSALAQYNGSPLTWTPLKRPLQRDPCNNESIPLPQLRRQHGGSIHLLQVRTWRRVFRRPPVSALCYRRPHGRPAGRGSRQGDAYGDAAWEGRYADGN